MKVRKDIMSTASRTHNLVCRLLASIALGSAAGLLEIPLVGNKKGREGRGGGTRTNSHSAFPDGDYQSGEKRWSGAIGSEGSPHRRRSKVVGHSHFHHLRTSAQRKRTHSLRR